jgi:hypothetical protein
VFTVEDMSNIPVPTPRTSHSDSLLEHVNISKEVVRTKCLKLKPDKASGGDNIPPRVLKETADSV